MAGTLADELARSLTRETARAIRPHPLSLPDEALIREPEVRLCVPYGRTKLHTLIAEGGFPQPSRVPGTSVRIWRVRQIRKYLAETFPEASGEPGQPTESVGGEASA